MLKFYKSLLLIAISISCSYSMEQQNLYNNIKSETTLCNEQQLSQQTEYKNSPIKNMAYDTQQHRKEIIDKFIFDDSELINLSKYLLSKDDNTNKSVINYIKDYIIKPRDINKSEVHDKKTLTTVHNISKGNFYVQSEQKDINNIELEEEQQNVKLSKTQKKNISFLYAAYALSYFFYKNSEFKRCSRAGFVKCLLQLCDNKQISKMNKKNAPVNIVLKKIKTICGNDTNKIDTLANKIVTGHSKHYQIDENNNILYRLVNKEYQTKLRRNKSRTIYNLKFLLRNNAINKQDLNKHVDNCIIAFKNIVEQYRSDKSTLGENDFKDNKLQEYINNIDNTLKKYADELLKNVKSEILIEYIEKYSDTLDKRNQQDEKKISALVNNINKNNILQKEDQCVKEQDILKDKNIQNNTKIIVPLEKNKKQNENITLLENEEKCDTNNIEFNNNLNNIYNKESIISYNENNNKHISIGNKHKKYNQEIDINNNSMLFNNAQNIKQDNESSNINKIINIPYQECINNQMFLNNLFPFNNNVNTFFWYIQPYNHFTQLLGNIHNNSFIPYQLQNNILELNQNSSIPYKHFTQELNNNTNSIIHNNNFVQYQVPNKIIVPNQYYNTFSNIQYNQFNQGLNHNINSIISNNNFIPYQYLQQKTERKK